MKHSIKIFCCDAAKIIVLLGVFLLLIQTVSCKKIHVHTLEYSGRIEPTCISEGQAEYWYCRECNKLFGDAIAKTEITMASTKLNITDHIFEEDAFVAPTCIEDGRTEGKHCAYCKQVFVSQETIFRLGHHYTELNYTWEWKNYCEANLHFICLNNEAHSLVYPAIITSTTIKPTCNNEGQIIYSACVVVENTTYIDQKVVILPPLEHEFDMEHIQWIWNGKTEAIALLECQLDNTHGVKYFAEITVETTDNASTIYIASVTIGGITYTNQAVQVCPIINDS